VTTLWWLEFLGGRAVIIEGESLAHARLLATVNEFGRASQFIDGYAIDPHFIELIPADCVGRTLSRADANGLLQQLRLSSRESARLAQESEASRTSASAAAAQPTNAVTAAGPASPSLRGSTRVRTAHNEQCTFDLPPSVGIVLVAFLFEGTSFLRRFGNRSITMCFQQLPRVALDVDLLHSHDVRSSSSARPKTPRSEWQC
jgi:hypothetical protein